MGVWVSAKALEEDWGAGRQGSLEECGAGWGRGRAGRQKTWGFGCQEGPERAPSPPWAGIPLPDPGAGRGAAAPDRRTGLKVRVRGWASAPAP